MEILLYILVGIAVLIALLLAYAATRPDHFRIERRARVNAPPDRVTPLVNDFTIWRQWSPWEKRDPDLRRTMSGASKGVGAVYGWEGNKQVGQGRMEIVESTPQRILIKLDFIKPFAAINMAEFTFTPADDATDVNWAMTGTRPFMMKVMGVFLDMDKIIGKDFETGLSSLKAQAEGRP
jgi:hypothetical protein